MGLFTSRIRRGFAWKTSPDSALSILCTLSPNLEVPSEIRSQHKLCNEAHKSTVYSLLPQLSLLERAVFLENASPPWTKVVGHPSDPATSPPYQL